MKKLLVGLIGLIGLNIGLTATANQIQQKVNSSLQLVSPKAWPFTAISESQEVPAFTWKYFAINNINLSTLGINSVAEFHQYNAIELPDILIRIGHYTALAGDAWSPKKRSLTSEDWYIMLDKIVENNTTVALRSAATMWYSSSGDLMLRLAYSARIAILRGHQTDYQHAVGGLITFYSGRIIKFN
ncbi:MAG: hypothetical protein REH79_02750 [Spiroplasma sp.]|nr:hypothetical protein [Spiroplasma sp.]